MGQLHQTSHSVSLMKGVMLRLLIPFSVKSVDSVESAVEENEYTRRDRAGRLHYSGVNEVSP